MVIGYWSGVVFAFSINTPATRRSMRERGRQRGFDSSDASTADEGGCSFIGEIPCQQAACVIESKCFSTICAA